MKMTTLSTKINKIIDFPFDASSQNQIKIDWFVKKAASLNLLKDFISLCGYTNGNFPIYAVWLEIFLALFKLVALVHWESCHITNTCNCIMLNWKLENN